MFNMSGTYEMCPRCGSMKLKTWNELDRDERIVAERLPASAQYAKIQREKHRFCTRCWFETSETEQEA